MSTVAVTSAAVEAVVAEEAATAVDTAGSRADIVTGNSITPVAGASWCTVFAAIAATARLTSSVIA